MGIHARVALTSIAQVVMSGLLVVGVVGCGSNGASSADRAGSVPVKTVGVPATTTTVEQRSSSMEPTNPLCGCPGLRRGRE